MINDYAMKTLVFCVKDKWKRHKPFSCPVFSYYMCWIYVYLRRYVYHESPSKCFRIHIFMFLCLFLGLKTAMLFYLSPILMFIKAYWFYLQPLHLRGFCTVQDCNIVRYPDWVYGLIYVCIYVFLIETTLLCDRLVLDFSREMTLSWHS